MSNIGELIQVYDKKRKNTSLFRIVETLCPENHINTVIEEYFQYGEDNAHLHLMRWGIERVLIDYEVII